MPRTASDRKSVPRWQGQDGFTSSAHRSIAAVREVRIFLVMFTSRVAPSSTFCVGLFWQQHPCACTCVYIDIQLLTQISPPCILVLCGLVGSWLCLVVGVQGPRKPGWQVGARRSEGRGASEAQLGGPAGRPRVSARRSHRAQGTAREPSQARRRSQGAQ